MSDKVYNVPAEWASRAFISNDKYLAMYKRSVEDPNGFWGELGKRIDWIKPYTKVKNTSYDPRQRLDQMVRGRHAQRLGQLPRPAPEDARRPGRHHLGRRRPHPRREDHLPAALRARVQDRQRAQGQRRQEGRPRHGLPADDPGGGLRHAGVRAHRRRALGGVRRLLARQPRRPHRRRRLQVHHHGGRGRSRRPADPAEKEHRRGTREVQGRREGAGRAPHRRARALDRRPRHLAARGAGQGRRQLSARGDERRGPAVHPLHLGLDRQAQGRAAHVGRLYRLCLDHPPARVRLSRRRHLLVHRRRRLGDGPQLHPLWPPLERRHHADVRGRAELPDAPRASGT